MVDVMLRFHSNLSVDSDLQQVRVVIEEVKDVKVKGSRFQSSQLHYFTLVS